MHLGMVGLGKMGLNMTKRLVGGGHNVTGHARTEKSVKAGVAAGAVGASSLKELVDSLPSPKVVWLMVPAGEATDKTIDVLKGLLSKGDYIIDGGNSFYKDDLRRAEDLKDSGINYMDVGTSGGIWGLTEGYCLMAGGDEVHFKYLEPVFVTLAPPQGYLHCGPVGAGHYVKMVHNGIEYGMMEAYAEGFELMQASQYGDALDFEKVAGLWNRGSVVRSWLLELLEGAFKKEGDLASIADYVEDSGEGRWTVKEGVDLSVPLPVISASLDKRFRSRQTDTFSGKVLAALRNEFGGHAVKKSGKKGEGKG